MAFQDWGENDRGVSFTFGADVVSRFLRMHDLELICRGHQVGYIRFIYLQFYLIFVILFEKVVEDGYEFFAKRQLVTLFSAPNYCGEFDNAGGMMTVDESLLCSFQVGKCSQNENHPIFWHFMNFSAKIQFIFQILKPSEKKAKYQYNSINNTSRTNYPK